jgi:hypothetical protein
MEVVIVCRLGDIQLGAEPLALAPGAWCRVGRSVGSGAPEAGQRTGWAVAAAAVGGAMDGVVDDVNGRPKATA